MNDEVQMAVDTKLGVIRDYYEVPAAIEGQYDEFLSDVMTLAESCSAYMDFEEKFAAAGLDQKMTALIMKCTPKPQEKMSAKDTMKAAKNAYGTTVDTGAGKKAWLKQGISDIAGMAQTEAESEMFHQSREMRDVIEEAHPELHEARNTVNQARTAAWHLFGKKKDK